MMDQCNSSEEIISLWQKFTLIKPDLQCDFFDSGGDSLSAVNMIVEIQNRYSVNIALEDFMRQPTLSFLFKALIENKYLE